MTLNSKLFRKSKAATAQWLQLWNHSFHDILTKIAADQIYLLC